MSMYVNHAPRLETHSRMHASAYQYMHMDIYTHICMCISMCIFVMRRDSRHIRIYTRACCDRAHLFANMNTYTRLCHIVYTYAYVHAILVHIYICTWTPTRAYVYMFTYMYVYICDARRLETHSHMHIYLLCWCTSICKHAHLSALMSYLCLHMHTCMPH
jgi:hypothetical protein